MYVCVYMRERARAHECVWSTIMTSKSKERILHNSLTSLNSCIINYGSSFFHRTLLVFKCMQLLFTIKNTCMRMLYTIKTACM